MIETRSRLSRLDLEVTRIQVTKDYATMIAPVRGDEAKLQQVSFSVFSKTRVKR